MSIKLTESQVMLHQMVTDFADKEVKPLDMLIDKQRDFPNELWNKLVNTGFLGLTIPEEYGGAGFDAIASSQTIYDFAVRNASVAFTLEGHYKSVDQVLKYATPELKEKYLPQANHRIFGFSSTEPQGGSNVMGFTAKAVKEGDKWILNGNKTMITNGGLAEVYCVLLKTSPTELSCFLVDEDMPGFKHGKRESFIGMNGTPIGEIFLEDVVVSEDHLLGKVGQGVEIGDNAHYDARISMGAIAAGITEHALNIAVDYAKQREVKGIPITQLYSIQEKITEIAIAKENTQLLYQEAAKLKMAGKPYAKVATMAKSYGSRASYTAADQALQVLGGYGYSQEYPVEHLIRDARALQLAEGSLEKMMIEIAKEVVNEGEE
ncbi:acyl-CoA dehydrogenase family protein [Carnobacterium viridans]|uniref:Acyl-CoA dehydrogenase n=1 Tax=Carnobacterium viridans TaxID=174587 RepID=A0A1H0ZCS4_9LACT|nr:acyl-CoA dehydrogenase family protein [Carnobacterium viridans]UDE94691.1 acyl-CoA dehydrogenase family protein [Carnobacterium viridans]SDQ25285.1 Acyl-CoA dehydrogenase [Carnobacterium viridans]